MKGLFLFFLLSPLHLHIVPLFQVLIPIEKIEDCTEESIFTQRLMFVSVRRQSTKGGATEDALQWI